MNSSNSKSNPKQHPADTVEAPTRVERSSGSVKFDDRGNAIWEWSVSTGAFGTTQRMRKQENESLSLANDAPTPFDSVRANPLGTKKGYNPYDSGKLGKTKVAPKKKDLRRLGDWLKLKKQHAQNKKDED